MDEATAREELFGLVDDRSGAALLVGLRLGLFTCLAAEPLTASQLARKLGADPAGVEVLANALAAIGLLRKDAARYANAELAAHGLVRGQTSFLGDHLLAGGARTATWNALLRAVRRGPPRRAASAKAGLPRALSLALYRDSKLLGPPLARAVDLSGMRRLLDVGGGLGGYAAAFCTANPGLQATVFELPAVVKQGRALLAASGGPARLDFVEGDFLRDPLPSGYDAVLASDILHAQRPADAERIVHRLHDALAPGGLLVLRDVLMDAERTSPRWAALFSLTLLAMSSGRCYAEEEVRGWLVDAGFVDVREVVVETEPWDPNCVLLATRV